MNIKVSRRFVTGKILSRTKTQLLVLLTVLMLIGGCASKQANESSKEDNRLKAAESNTSLGLEYMNRGQYEVALGKLKKAIREKPDYAPAHTVLAVLYERIGEMELAGQHYQEAYKSDPEDGDVNNNYGVYLCQTGKPDVAMEHFQIALEDPFYSSPAIALANAGSCALGANNFDDADEYLRAALQIEPELPDALVTMARLKFVQKDLLRSRAFMQRYEAVANHNADSLLLAYRIEIASQNQKVAARYLQILESSFPESGQTAEARRLSGR